MEKSSTRRSIRDAIDALLEEISVNYERLGRIAVRDNVSAEYKHLSIVTMQYFSQVVAQLELLAETSKLQEDAWRTKFEKLQQSKSEWVIK